MPGLFNTLATAADALGVFSKALNTVSNNVENSGTPGFARQDFSVVAQPFNPRVGLPGGIAAGPDGALWFTNSNNSSLSSNGRKSSPKSTRKSMNLKASFPSVPIPYFPGKEVG